ncbi:MAG: thioredoxin domain-containing protein [Bacillota bacterium]|nr:MAG: thioredoxin domain-containing protein [Bacillota bacterium]
MTEAGRSPNRLIHEVSPYLLQHAYNPVDWYPWGPEALERARREDKPILLSVGYSSCHWCHVMERESFSDPETAALMNQHFVCIKVDREERPDIDQVYQTVCQLVTRSGGWPLTVFLTPDLRPFFVGTYFPPEDRYGRPGFRRLVATLAEAWRSRRQEVEQVASQCIVVLKQVEIPPPSGEEGLPDRSLLQQAAEACAARFDRRHGGFGGAPKFPGAPTLDFLLRYGAARGGEPYVEMVAFTLRKMAEGGIYDQIGGGFHRYAVDPAWAIPHFEKMLYDNALLPPLYLAVWQITGDDFYAQIARETLAYVEREMTHPLGGFYTAQDADSEGVEGKYYVWTPAEVREVLGPELGELLCRHLGVTPAGNFEGGATVLHVAASARELAELTGRPEAEVAAALAEGKARLLAARARRVPPGRDEKILTGWNGLMISAFARAARILDEPHYAAVARRAADFVLTELVTGGPPGAGGRLLRRWKDGKAGIEAFLEDYAHLIAGLIDLYEATFAEAYLAAAIRLTREALDRFWDPEGGGFFLAPASPDLVHRPKEAFDSAIPADSSVMVMNLLRLYPFTGEERFRAVAEAIFQSYRGQMERYPGGMASLLSALDFYLQGALEVTIVAPADDPEAAQWLRQLGRRYLPNLVLTRITPDRVPGPGGDPVPAQKEAAAPPPALPPAPPIWAGKAAADGRATAYVCRNFACSPPATTWEAIAAHLG